MTANACYWYWYHTDNNNTVRELKPPPMPKRRRWGTANALYKITITIDNDSNGQQDNNDNNEDACEHEYNRKEYAKKLRKDLRQSSPQELLAWKKKNTSSTTTHLSKAPQNVQDKWKKIKQICDDCPSKKLDIWVDGTYLLLLLFLSTGKKSRFFKVF